MNWTNLVWLGVGFGLGLVTCRLQRKSAAKLQAKPAPPVESRSELQLSPSKQLELAYQMATELSQFRGGYLARISHELRSPLNGLIGMHQLILSNLCDSPEEEREFIAQANTSAMKMVAALDRVLDAARVQHGTTHLDIQPASLATIFQEVYNLTYLQAKDRSVRLEIIPPDPATYVQVDVPRFRQILVHLVDAAVSRLPETPITVSAKLSPKSNQVHIWIEDQCPASDRSEPVNLLQINTATDTSLPSPGLTLLADQILLQMMQGHLEVIPVNSNGDASSEPDKDLALTQVRCTVPGYWEERKG